MLAVGEAGLLLLRVRRRVRRVDLDLLELERALQRVPRLRLTLALRSEREDRLLPGSEKGVGVGGRVRR